MPAKWMNYRGHHVFGDRVVLSYAIDGRPILESPEIKNGQLIQTLEISGGKELLLAVGQGLDSANAKTGVISTPTEINLSSELDLKGNANAAIVLSLTQNDSALEKFSAVAITGDTSGLRWEVDQQQRMTVLFPQDDQTRVVQIHRGQGAGQPAFQEWLESVRASGTPVALLDWTTGGQLLWPDVLTTVGYQGLEQEGYALDTLTLPDETPWNTWFRTSALDFFPDGRMALATYGGDVWIVSGIDEDLTELKWKRFAGGLYEPFGVKVVDDHVYVTCKDRLTKLHDRNADGEADFYESFSADTDVSVNFHAFNFDLQTDQQGNFYYSKSGHGGDSPIPGAVIKVSSDGQNRELFCTGFRTPNGMGMLPDGRPTNSDNQGQWTPASKVNLLRRDGFYGWV